MAGTNNLYPYGESATNILSNSQYQADSERTAGAARGGIARSAIYNKALRQSAAGAYAVGALVAKSGKNADDSSASALATNLQAAVSYQAAHFVASDVTISGNTATATVAELATTAEADLPALFALSMVLDGPLTAGASVAIASSLPSVTLSWPIYVGAEALEDDTITGGAITLLIDTVGGKAFFKAGGGSKLPDNLPPLNPNFALEVQPSGTSITVTADKLLVSPEITMLAGGVWVAKQSGAPTGPDDGTQIKAWGRNDLIYYASPGVALSTLPEGTIVKLNESGRLVEFYVAKHDYESELNGAGRTLVVRKDIYDGRAWDNGKVNAYASSDLDSWFNSTYKNMLDADIRSLIGTTKIRYTPGNGNWTVGTLERAVFALSATELGQSVSWFNVEGSALPIANTLKVAYLNGNANTQWTRSPYTNGTNYAVYLGSNGNVNYYTCYSTFGSRPAFTLPSTTNFLDKGDGTYVLASGTQTAAAGDTDETVSWTFDWPADTPCYVRQYTYNYKNQYQTMLEGAVVSTEDGPAYSAVLAENTWSMIKQACVDNDPIVDQWLVGDSKNETIGREVLTFVILGKDHDDRADGSGKAKLSIGMKDCMAQTRQMNATNTNAGSFVGSAMYDWLSGTLYPSLPDDLKNSITKVNKKTSEGGGSSTIQTDAMDLWLLAEIEVFGAVTYSVAGEGTQYSYYTTAANRIKTLSNGAGVASYWWERSPNRNSSAAVCSVDTLGSANTYGVDFSLGVCFGFCI